MDDLRSKAGMTRRQALLGLGALATTAALGCEPRSADEAEPSTLVPSTNPEPPMSSPPSLRQPAVFLPHGGGPWPFVDEKAVFGVAGMWDKMAAYMHQLRMVPPTPPQAVLMISAHWEEPVPTVMTASNPPMLYDYYNFPPEAYVVDWPAPGDPGLAGQVRDLLEGAGFRTAADPTRGFDHGTFVPLKLTYPAADVPTLQLSLTAGLDPRQHLAIGRALAPLRDTGVFIVGSGMSYHNLRALMRGEPRTVAYDSASFDAWLAESMSLDPSRRETRLVEWERAPAARAAHPREEHLLPLMVVAGAALEDAATLPYRDVVLGAHVSAVHFGARA